MSDKTQHILGLSIENFKKIGVFNVDLRDKNTLLVSGKNRQGKTSVLDAIHSALAGKQYWKKEIEQPIKDGAEEAHVLISTDKYEIHRYWKQNGKDYIKIKDKDGISQGTEETLLSRFYNDYSRDPQRMTDMDSKEQTEFIFDLIGMKDDLEALDQTKKKYYEERRDVNRDLKKAESKLDGMESFDEVPDVPDPSDLQNELEEIRQHNQTLEKMNRDRIVAENEIENIHLNFGQRIKTLEDDIEDLEDRLAKKRDELATQEKLEKEGVKAVKQKVKEINEAIDSFEERDPEPVKEQLNTISEKSAEKQKAEKYLETKKEAEELQKRSEELSASIDAVDEDKIAYIKKADMPVDGMSVDPETNQITYNGREVKDLSTSESIIFWSRVYLSTKPELKFMTLDNGESLDSDARSEIDAFAKENDLLYIITVVDESGETGIVLEEGEIKTNNYEN